MVEGLRVKGLKEVMGSWVTGYGLGLGLRLGLGLGLRVKG
jgi:hypothetical protein